MRRRIGPLTLTAALCLATPLSSEEVPKEKAAPDAAATLIGTYRIVGGEKFGAPIPLDKVDGSRVRIDKTTVTTTDKDNKQIYAATYQVDTGTKPWGITLTSTIPAKGEVAKGVVQVEGDTVKLCYGLVGAERPTDFKTRDKQLLFVLKRVADPDAK